MTFRLVFIAMVLFAASCTEPTVFLPCPVDAPEKMIEWNGLRYHTHLQDALHCSRVTGKPVLLAFLGWASLSTHDPWEVLVDDEVKELIRDHLVLCILLVDDKEPLTREDMIDFPRISDSRVPTTIGQRNILLETEHFCKTSQPLYALVNSDFVTLADPIGYVPKKTPDVLVDWIESTLEQLP